MRAGGLVISLALTFSCAGCLDDPVVDYTHDLIGNWRMAGQVMGKPADGRLYIMREGDYIFENLDTARVAQVAPSGAGRWSLSHDLLQLMAAAPSASEVPGQDPLPHRLLIVSLDRDRLVTSDADYGVNIEWVRIGPLN